MRDLLAAALLAAAAVPAFGQDVDWDFGKRLTSVEKRLDALEKRLDALATTQTVAARPAAKPGWMCDPATGTCRPVAVAPQFCGCVNCPAGGSCLAGECGLSGCGTRSVSGVVVNPGEILTHVNGVPVGQSFGIQPAVFSSGACVGGACGTSSFPTGFMTGDCSSGACGVQSSGQPVMRIEGRRFGGGQIRSGGGIFRGRSRSGGGCSGGNCGG